MDIRLQLAKMFKTISSASGPATNQHAWYIGYLETLIQRDIIDQARINDTAEVQGRHIILDHLY